MVSKLPLFTIMSQKTFTVRYQVTKYGTEVPGGTVNVEESLVSSEFFFSSSRRQKIIAEVLGGERTL